MNAHSLVEYGHVAVWGEEKCYIMNGHKMGFTDRNNCRRHLWGEYEHFLLVLHLCDRPGPPCFKCHLYFINFQSFALVMAFLPFQRMAVIRSNQPNCIVCKDLFKMVTDDNLFFFSFLTGSELTPSIRHSWLGDAARENIALTLTL